MGDFLDSLAHSETIKMREPMREYPISKYKNNAGTYAGTYGDLYGNILNLQPHMFPAFSYILKSIKNKQRNQGNSLFKKSTLSRNARHPFDNMKTFNNLIGSIDVVVVVIVAVVVAVVV